MCRTTECENCGNEIEQSDKYRTKKACSKECRYALSAKTTKSQSGAVTKVRCQGCGQEFDDLRSKPKKFCSRKCFLDSKAEASRVARTCAHCGEEFTAFRRTGQVYCSPICRNKHVAGQREVNYPECKSCGVSTGSYNRIYCPAHAVNGGPKQRPRLEAICVGCGEQFSRPSGYAGRMKYCSNKCSHHEVKSVRDKYVADLNGKAVVFHSGWEVRFWAICLRLEVDVRRYDGPDIETTEGVYRPDFIVGPDELIVEVKGWEERPGTAEKLLDAGVVLVGKESLNELEHIFNREQFLVILRKQ